MQAGLHKTQRLPACQSEAAGSLTQSPDEIFSFNNLLRMRILIENI
jgi:hypothetical protein